MVVVAASPEGLWVGVGSVCVRRRRHYCVLFFWGRDKKVTPPLLLSPSRPPPLTVGPLGFVQLLVKRPVRLEAVGAAVVGGARVAAPAQAHDALRERGNRVRKRTFSFSLSAAAISQGGSAVYLEAGGAAGGTRLDAPQTPIQHAPESSPRGRGAPSTPPPRAPRPPETSARAARPACPGRRRPRRVSRRPGRRGGPHHHRGAPARTA